MDKIQTEEYVRTADGKIGIFDRYSSRPEKSLYKSPFNCFIKFKNRKTPLQCCRDYIVKHSNNIIDLIEVGDYVNGYKVTGIMSGYVYLDKIDVETKKVKTLVDYQVKSVLTKEQFSSLEYII